MPEQQSSRQLAAIMFADIVGYTAMMQENEDNARRLRDRHRDVIERCISAHSGEIIQYYGDGTLSIFHSAKEAVLGALEIQQNLREEPRVPLRIGIHVGDIVRDEGGIFGDGVNVASRIESLAVPGAVLFSDKVCRELENHPSIKTRSLGSYAFKNVKRPVEVFALDHNGIIVPRSDDVANNAHKKLNKTIAVLPFQSRPDDPESGYFCEGVAEEIITGLTKVDGLAIISRTTSLAVASSGDAMMSEAQRLNISHLLEGSVRKAGNRVRVSVRLTSSSDGFQLWSEVYERELEDIFAVQDEIAQHVVNGLRVNFNIPSKSEPIVAKATNNIDAYKLYLKGIHHWNKRNPEECVKAIGLLEDVAKMDPDFATAQCTLSNCYAFLGSCGHMPTTEAYARSLDYAMTAISRNPNLAEAHLAMAVLKFYHMWDWEATRESLEKAESLGLNSSLFNQTSGFFLAAMGQFDEGIEKMQKALEMDPLSLPVMATLIALNIFANRNDEAIRVANEVLDLEPSFRSAHEYKGVALLCQDKIDEAINEFEIYWKMVNKPMKGLLGLVLGHFAKGDVAESDKYLQVLYERKAIENTAAVDVDLAISHLGRREYDKGIDCMNRVYDQRFSIACMGMIWIVRCPYFQDVWDKPRFIELMDRMRLPKIDRSGA